MPQFELSEDTKKFLLELFPDGMEKGVDFSDPKFGFLNKERYPDLDPPEEA